PDGAQAVLTGGTVSYGKVVVGTDGSETARVAERVATRIVNASQGRLFIVSAYRDEDARARLEEALVDARTRAEKSGVQPETELVYSDPAGAITEVAEREQADLMVVGDVGMGGPKRLRLGGVADRVSHHMPCDLLIVRTSKADTSRVPGTYESVLIATDGSPTADHAARAGTEFAVMMGAGVELVHVGDELMGKIVLKDTAERLGDAELPIRPLTGADPGQKIAELAGSEAHDLVVVGNKGLVGALRFLLGAVPNRVSHLAPCDVLIVNTVGRGLDDIQPGEGALVVVDGKKVAAYRDEAGSMVTLSPKCKHLGCTVGWNDGAKTWDCPCHGSRYDARGKVIGGPAERDLDEIEIPARG
ncbi:MAG: universal stress protein, partial [Actinobacteria bacterium]|nr:universal stress protein [Actinomycetota bacterium]